MVLYLSRKADSQNCGGQMAFEYIKRFLWNEFKHRYREGQNFKTRIIHLYLSDGSLPRSGVSILK